MYGRSAYESNAAQTAGPAQLVLMLYDGALVRIESAADALASVPPRIEEANTALTKAQAIIDELAVTLDHDRGGAVAGNLADLYVFCLGQLVDANIRKDATPLHAVVSILTQLRDVWDQACVHAAVAS